jgi:hypothetical protein
MKALWKSDSPTFLPLPPMLTNTEAELLRQNKLLRDHVARLVSTNVDLLRQIEHLLRERGQTGVDELAAVAASSDRLNASRRRARPVRGKG